MSVDRSYADCPGPELKGQGSWHDARGLSKIKGSRPQGQIPFICPPRQECRGLLDGNARQTAGYLELHEGHQ